MTNFCKNVPTTKRAGSMEPSAHDMCMAIADRFDAANEWLRQKKIAQLEKMLVDMLDAGETTQSCFVRTDTVWLRMPKQ